MISGRWVLLGSLSILLIFFQAKHTFRVGIRRGSAQIWQPLPSTLNILQRAR